MGYTHRKTFRLVFADPDMEGLEVRVRSMSIDQSLRHADLANIGDDRAAGVTKLVNLLLDIDEETGKRGDGGIRSWNLESPDEQDVPRPVPLTPEGLRGEGLDLLTLILRTWAEASTGVSRPLGQPSPGGQPSLEASIPMDTPSENPESLPVPS